MLYDTLPPLDAAGLRADLEPLVGPCRVEWASSGTSGPSDDRGVVEFGAHRLAMIALNAPVSAQVLARTVMLSPMPSDERDQLMGHKRRDTPLVCWR